MRSTDLSCNCQLLTRRSLGFTQSFRFPFSRLDSLFLHGQRPRYLQNTTKIIDPSYLSDGQMFFCCCLFVLFCLKEDAELNLNSPRVILCRVRRRYTPAHPPRFCATRWLCWFGSWRRRGRSFWRLTGERNAKKKTKKKKPDQ